MTAVTDPSTVDTAAGFSYLWHVTDSNGQTITDGTGANFTFTPDDNGSYSVSLTATDKDGGVSTAAVDAISVTNVAPSGVTVSATPNPISEDQTTTLTGSFTDPGTVDTHSVDISWGDGSPDTILSLGAGVVSIPGQTHQYQDNPAGQPNGSFTINVKVTDKDGGIGTGSTSVEVDNVAPTATITNPILTSPEGTSITLNSSVTDPSPADAAAGFTYLWHVTDSTGQTITDGTGANFTFTPDDNGSYSVSLTATDKDGGVSTAAVDAISVTNVAPTATFSNNGPVAENIPVTVAFSSPTDPSSADTAAGFHYDYSLNEGSLTSNYNSAGTATTDAFTFATAGTYTVWGRILDKNNGFTDYSTTVTVQPFEVTSFTPNESGFDVKFNMAPQLGLLNLYEGGGDCARPPGLDGRRSEHRPGQRLAGVERGDEHGRVRANQRSVGPRQLHGHPGQPLERLGLGGGERIARRQRRSGARRQLCHHV